MIAKDKINEIMRKYPPVNEGWTGATILCRLRRGHMISRAAWRHGNMIRVTNETGYDKAGNLTFDDRKTNLYTISTNGYFMHLGYSAQPLKNQTGHRDGEGIGCLFADDWVDHGFITTEAFDDLTDELKPLISDVDREINELIQLIHMIKNGYEISQIARVRYEELTTRHGYEQEKI